MEQELLQYKRVSLWLVSAIAVSCLLYTSQINPRWLIGLSVLAAVDCLLDIALDHLLAHPDA